MTAAKAYAQGSYGAFELKRCYQKNMITGTIVSGALPILIFLILALVGYMTVGDELIEKIDQPGKYIEHVPPPQNIRQVLPQTTTNVKPDLPQFATTLRPVEDDQDVSTTVVMSGLEKIKILELGQDADIAQGIANGVYNTDEMLGEIIPEPTEFIPVTKEPVLVYAPTPDYPEMARKAGMQGEVTVQVYVDKNGDILDARIAKSSGSSAGFEEAALAAAWKRKYTPALQNDQPVGVWVTFQVKFKLHQ